MTESLIDRLKKKETPKNKDSNTTIIFNSLEEIEAALKEGFTLKQIADEFGIEQFTFYSSLSRARKKRLRLQSTQQDPKKPTSQISQPKNQSKSDEKTEQSVQRNDDSSKMPRMLPSKTGSAFLNVDLPHLKNEEDN